MRAATTTAATSARAPAPTAPPATAARGRYALVATGPSAPQFFSEGGTYTLSRDAVTRASSSSSGGRLRFGSVVVVRDGARRRSSSVAGGGGCSAAAASAASAYVPGAYVEAELLEHFDPSHFGGALSRFRVTRIVVEGEEEEGEAVAAR